MVQVNIQLGGAVDVDVVGQFADFCGCGCASSHSRAMRWAATYLSGVGHVNDNVRGQAAAMGELVCLRNK